MSSVQIAKKIELLPEMLQLQVADFVEFLLSRHFKDSQTPPDASELTPEQKTVLDSRLKEYHETPSSVVSMDVLKNRLMEKYGLSNLS